MNTPKIIREMLIELRLNHIDIMPIIKEELEQILPSLIEDIILSIYQLKISEGE